MSDGTGYTPIVEDPDWPIKRVPVHNAGLRVTLEPKREKGFRVRPRRIFDKLARRMLRRRAFGVNNSRIMNKLDKTWLVKAACYRETDNGHEARRLFDAEIAEHTEKRLAEKGGPNAPRMPRSEFRARVVPGRGARRRAEKRDGRADYPRNIRIVEGTR